MQKGARKAGAYGLVMLPQMRALGEDEGKREGQDGSN